MKKHPAESRGCGVMVAFSGTVRIDGCEYTEAELNVDADGRQISTDKRFRREFRSERYNILVVANKYQTGFDEPLLHSMYVDKRLKGVNAVQTLSRLNRTAKDKTSTFVLDFANDEKTISESFQPFYETTLLEGRTDFNRVYDLRSRIKPFMLYNGEDVEKYYAFMTANAGRKQDPAALGRLSGIMKPIVERYLDLGTEEGIEHLFSCVEEFFGGLDVAVNNAGWDPGYVPLDSIDYEFYRKLTNMNIKGTLFCCLNEIRLMRKSGNGGAIINIGSVQMETTVPGRTLYAMSKGAIHSMTGELALEGGPEGIRVNCIAPGYIEVDRMCGAPGFNREEIASGIPVRRLGIPRDIGECALFLASEKASFVNGQTFVVDGGVPI